MLQTWLKCFPSFAINKTFLREGKLHSKGALLCYFFLNAKKTTDDGPQTTCSFYT